MNLPANPTIRRFLMTSAVALCLPLTSFAQEASAPAEGNRPTMGRQAGHGAHGFERPDSLLNPGVLRRLELTQVQRDEMKKIFEAGKDARRKQHEEIRASRQALRNLVLTGQYSAAKAKELANVIAAQESAGILAMAEQGNKLFQILTPEQRAKLTEMPARKPEHKN